MNKIITLGDIFRNLETEEKAFKFLRYVKDMQEEIERLKEQLNDEIDDELKQSNIMLKQQNEIERLNNIIKEVREYIEKVETLAMVDKVNIFSMSTLKMILVKSHD